MAKLLNWGGKPVNDGERLVINTLQQQLPDTYTLIPNVEIQEGGRPPYDYDCIVLAPHALYVVEIKQWRGGIEGDDYTWHIGSQRISRPNPYSTTNNKARVLKSHLSNQQPAIGSFWVQAIVAIADDQGTLTIHGQARDWVRQYTDLPALLQDASAIPYHAAHLRQHRGPIENSLQHICRGQQPGPRRFGPYVVKETLSHRDNISEYLAQHELQREARVVRLRVFSYDPYQSDELRARQMEIIRREAESLQKIGGHVNLITSSDLFQDTHDPNLYFTVTDWSDTGTLRDLLTADIPLSLSRKLELALGIAAGLKAAHEAGVIHRDVRPENILISHTSQPRLMNFDHARLTIPGAMTVGPVRHDPDVSRAYMAPELLNPTITPTAAADVYSLGCILFEMLVGAVLYDTPEDARDQNTSAGGPAALGASDIPDRLNLLIARMMKPDVNQRPQTAQEVWEELRAISQTPSATLQPEDAAMAEPGASQEEEPDFFERGDTIDQKYQVVKMIATGGFSQVYRVFDHVIEKEFALKLFKNPSGSLDYLRQEIQAMFDLDNPHIARAYNWGILRPSGRPYLVSEFVAGDELSKFTTPEKRLSAHEAVDAILSLLRALEYIHPNVDLIEELRVKIESGEVTQEEYEQFGRLQNEGLLHRDIKPANLILVSNGLLKLVDFNIAARSSEASRTQAGTPPYMLPEIGIMRWNADADLFATGIVLYELLTGHHPYPERQPSIEIPPADPRDYQPNLHPDLANILLKAVSCNPEIRYHSARRLRLDLAALDGVYLRAIIPTIVPLQNITLEPWERHKENYNPYVTRLLTLYSQARRDNSGTRGLEGIAQHTYIPTRLDEYLLPDVVDGRYRLVIITGNAGDGKTAFIKRLENHIIENGGHLTQPTPNSSNLTFHNIQFITNYDGSQDEGAERANDQVLNEFFAPFTDAELSQTPTPKEVHLIAINKGRILDFFMDGENGNHYSQLADSIDNFFDPDETTRPLPDWLAIIDLNNRSIVAADSNESDKSIFDRQIEALLKPEFWSPCQSCAFKDRCFIKYNADSLTDTVSGPAVRERLRTLFEIVHLRRKLHITMRDMRSALSWMIFRDHNCDNIAEVLAAQPDPAAQLDLFYYNAFAINGSPLAGQHDDRLVRLLRQIDPAEVANPADDRTLHFQTLSALRLMTFDNRSPLAATWLDEWELETGWEASQKDEVLAEHRQKHAIMRRRAYFERRDDGWLNMLPYQQLDTFRAVTQVKNVEEEKRHELKEMLVTGISKADGARNPELASTNICLRASQVSKVIVKSFRLFPSTDFQIRLPEMPNHQYLEYTPDQLIFYHDPEDPNNRIPTARDAELIVSLDLLEMLYQVTNGFVPSPDDISGVFVNLTIFKNALAHLPYKRVLLTRDDLQFYKLELIDTGVVGLEKLDVTGYAA